MSDKKTFVLAAVVILMGFSVVVAESKLVSYLPAGWWMRLLQPMGGVLFAAAGILSWNYYRRTENVFFKMLTFALFLGIGLALEGLLFGLFRFPFPEPGEFSAYTIAKLAHILVNESGSFLFAILLVNAISYYDQRERFFSLGRGFLLLLVAFVVLWVSWNVISVLRVDWQRSFDLTVIFMTMESVLLAVIYLDGFRIATRKTRLTGSVLMKWLAAVMALETFISLSWVFTWLFFFADLGTSYAVYYNYVMYLILTAIPVLLVTALATCGKECHGDFSS